MMDAGPKKKTIEVICSELAENDKPFLCKLGFHKISKWNHAGYRYEACKRCLQEWCLGLSSNSVVRRFT